MTTPQPDPDVIEVDGEDVEVLNFQAPERDKTYAKVPFTIDDDPEILWAIKPKKASLIEIGALVADAQDDQAGKDKDYVSPRMFRVYHLFMKKVLDPQSQEYLQRQFDDPDSDVDIDVLDPVIDTLLGKWYPRPTKRRSGSAPLPRTTGKRGTGRARTKGSTR